MDKGHLKEHFKKRTIIKIFLKNNNLYTGKILNIGETSILISDKYGEHVLISLDSISYVVPANEKKVMQK